MVVSVAADGHGHGHGHGHHGAPPAHHPPHHAKALPAPKPKRQVTK